VSGLLCIIHLFPFRTEVYSGEDLPPVYPTMLNIPGLIFLFPVLNSSVRPCATGLSVAGLQALTGITLTSGNQERDTSFTSGNQERDTSFTPGNSGDNSSHLGITGITLHTGIMNGTHLSPGDHERDTPINTPRLTTGHTYQHPEVNNGAHSTP